MGHVLTVASEDGRIRVVPLFIQHGEKAYPSLALQIARVYTETPMEQVELINGVVRMGAWDIPVRPRVRCCSTGPPPARRPSRGTPSLDVVSGDVPDEAFRGKAVLVAGTASPCAQSAGRFSTIVPPARPIASTRAGTSQPLSSR